MAMQYYYISHLWACSRCAECPTRTASRCGRERGREGGSEGGRGRTAQAVGALYREDGRGAYAEHADEPVIDHRAHSCAGRAILSAIVRIRGRGGLALLAL